MPRETVDAVRVFAVQHASGGGCGVTTPSPMLADDDDDDDDQSATNHDDWGDGGVDAKCIKVVVKGNEVDGKVVVHDAENKNVEDQYAKRTDRRHFLFCAKPGNSKEIPAPYRPYPVVRKELPQNRPSLTFPAADLIMPGALVWHRPGGASQVTTRASCC